MDTLQKGELPSVGALSREAWGRLRSHVVELVKLEAIIWVVTFLGSFFLIFFAEEVVPTFPGGIIGTAWSFLVVGMILRIVVSVAQIKTLASSSFLSAPSAWSYGVGRIVPILGCAILLFLIYLPLILMLVLFAIGSIGIAPLLLNADIVEAVGSILQMSGIALLVLIPVYMFLGVRLSLVLILAGMGETEGAFRESWNLTNGKFWAVLWRIFVMSLLIGFLSIGATVALASLFSLFGDSGSDSIMANAGSSILQTIIQSFFTMFGVAYLVSLIRALQKNS